MSMGLGLGVAQSLPHMYQDLSSSPRTHIKKLGTLVPTCSSIA